MNRSTPLRRSSPPRRSRIRPVSAKRARRKRAWTAIKALVHTRDGFACRRCGHTDPTARTLNAHHVLTRARGGSDEPENLVTLCAGPGTNDCHGQVHGHPEQAERDGWLRHSWDAA